MAVSTDDDFAGSVSGGCVEADVIAAASEIIADGRPRLFSFGVEDETAWRVGLPCGGRIKIFAELFKPDADLALFKQIAGVPKTRQTVIVETDLETGARRSFAQGQSLPLELQSAIASTPCAFQTTPAGAAFVAALRPPVRIVIVGASHLGQCLAQFSRLAGFGLAVVDPRDTFAAPDRFPGIELIADWPETALPALALDRETALLALSHVKDIDDSALKLALPSSCFYVGALGSKKNAAARRERLIAAGVTDTELQRLHAPIGLDIGAKTPEEIALSILAEIVATMRGKAVRA